MSDTAPQRGAGVDAVDEVRRALLLAVGHGLRTPIASAKAAAAGLHVDGRRLPDGDARELVAIIEESLDRLDYMVDNLLTLGRLAAGSIAPRRDRIDLADAVDLALETLRGVGLVLHEFPAGPQPVAVADPILTRRILVNLIRNALQHSPSDAPPKVIARDDGGTPTVLVVDHGPGLPSSWREVTTPFPHRGDRQPRHGLGLGLAVSRGLAEAMAGTLTPTVTPGGGLTMALQLPSRPPTRRPPAENLPTDQGERA